MLHSTYKTQNFQEFKSLEIPGKFDKVILTSDSGIVVVNNTRFLMVNCQIDHCSTTGGAVSVLRSTDVTISGSQFFQNTVDNGGAFYLVNSRSDIFNCTINDNTVNT